MKINASDLEGLALDWAVAKCEEVVEWKLDPREFQIERQLRQNFRYSTDWSQGGPIIEREKIDLNCWHFHSVPWKATIDDEVTGYGTTPLIAAMRCFVASKLGEEIEIPEELLS